VRSKKARRSEEKSKLSVICFPTVPVLSLGRNAIASPVG
jgi:hypothetical protein